MCVSVYGGETWITRNLCMVRTTERNENGSINAVVVVSSDPQFPVGTKTVYKTSMGHVACEGSENEDDDDDECILHPLDAIQEVFGTASRKVDSEFKKLDPATFKDAPAFFIADNKVVFPTATVERDDGTKEVVDLKIGHTDPA